MTDSEKAWGKKNGLKKTDMKTMPRGTRGRYCSRWVYQANDGSLYYKDKGVWNGTFEEYCYKVKS